MQLPGEGFSRHQHFQKQEHFYFWPYWSGYKVVQFPCLKCIRAAAKDHESTQCEICNKWVHKACNNLNTYTYKKLHKDKSLWYCICCLQKDLRYWYTIFLVLTNIDLDCIELAYFHSNLQQRIVIGSLSSFEFLTIENIF